MLRLAHLRTRCPKGRRGITVMEVAMALVVMTLAVGMLSSTLGSTSRVAPMQRESALAALGARSVLESMRAEPFAELFARYNQNPDDDPAGPGSGPGAFFAVQGLRPVPGTDQPVGQVIFPGDGTLLLENVDSVELGMPRDLDGDGQIGAADVSASYRLLPVEVHVRWESMAGPRELRLFTMFVAP